MVARLLRLWDHLEDQVGGVFLFLSVLLVFLQIVMRAVFSFGISGMYELATFSAILSIFFTASVGVKRNIHVRIDLLPTVLGPAAARWLEMAVLCIMLGVSGWIALSGWLLVEESLMLGDSTLGTIRIPMWVPQLVMPVGGALMALRVVQRMVVVIGQRDPAARAAAAEVASL